MELLEAGFCAPFPGAQIRQVLRMLPPLPSTPNRANHQVRKGNPRQGLAFQPSDTTQHLQRGVRVNLCLSHCSAPSQAQETRLCSIYKTKRDVVRSDALGYLPRCPNRSRKRQNALLRDGSGEPEDGMYTCACVCSFIVTDT